MMKEKKITGESIIYINIKRQTIYPGQVNANKSIISL